MNDVKDLFKLKDFQINPFVIKNIRKIGIDLNEFLLVLYFINYSPTLDLVNIKEVLGFNEEEVLNTYSSLVSKGIIEVNVIKENGKVTEKISLEMLYDKLVLNSKDDSYQKTKESDIFSKFESEFGRVLSPMEYETINNWIDNGVSESVIIGALKEAVMSGVSNLRYIDKIIYEWTKKNGKFQSEEEFVPLYDCDWLGAMSKNNE